MTTITIYRQATDLTFYAVAHKRGGHSIAVGHGTTHAEAVDNLCITPFQGHAEVDRFQAVAWHREQDGEDGEPELHEVGEHATGYDTREDARLCGASPWVVDATPEGVTDEQLRALRSEAKAAGDGAQVDLCDQALAGDDAARTACVEVIADAEAQ